MADQTQALHELRRQGIEIPTEDLTYFSPYPTSKVKRFGEYPARIKTEAGPAEQELTGERAGARHAGSLNRPCFARQNYESPIFWRISPWGLDI